MSIDNLFLACGGIRTKSEQRTGSGGRAYTSHTFYVEGDIVLPKNVYIEVTGTATKGTIGRLVDIEVQTFQESQPNGTVADKIQTYYTTFIYEVDGRKPKGRIQYSHANVLVGEHQTKYVRNVKSHDKVEVKNPVNKYKQEMKRGDWVIGVKKNKTLGIGRITRWTNHNVWAVLGDDLKDKSKEFQFMSIQETFTMPNDDHVQLLTMAVLKGWRGR